MTFTADAHERLDKALARWLPAHSRARLVKLIDAGEVLVNTKTAKPSLMLEVGWTVEVPVISEAAEHDLTPADIPLEIAYEDEYLLVVNKPRGLAVHPASTLKEPSMVNALLARNHELSGTGGSYRPGIVHRLDKDTTGLLVVAKTDAVHVALARQIAGKTAERRYMAVVAGRVEREKFTIEAGIGRSKRNRLLMAVDHNGKPAITHVKVLDRVDAGTLVGCRLETGRTHQIRVHLSAVAHPVLGDRLYAPKEFQKTPLQLHSAYLSFVHPVTEKQITCTANTPPDFLASAVGKEQLDPF